MDWNAPTWWWLGAAALVAVELATGTFYLLMLSIGAAAAALAAHAGLATTGQLLVGAAVGSVAVVLWHRRQHRVTDTAGDASIHLDVGGRVHVAAWQPDGTARVHYRGAGWDARFAGSGAPAPGDHIIRAIDGNQLLLDRPAA